MGKFTGVLIASDFDNTLIYTENALKGLEPMPELLPENRELTSRAVLEHKADLGLAWDAAAEHRGIVKTCGLVD